MATPLKAVQSAQPRTLRPIHADAYVSCGTVRKRICTLFGHFGNTFLTLGLRREGRRGLVMVAALNAVQSARLRTLPLIHANGFVGCGTVRKRF